MSGARREDDLGELNNPRSEPFGSGGGLLGGVQGTVGALEFRGALPAHPVVGWGTGWRGGRGGWTGLSRDWRR